MISIVRFNEFYDTEQDDIVEYITISKFEQEFYTGAKLILYNKEDIVDKLDWYGHVENKCDEYGDYECIMEISDFDDIYTIISDDIVRARRNIVNVLFAKWSS